jgi:hypothetical protein
LKYLDITNLDYIPFIIITACLLHNFIIDIEGEDTDIDGDESDDDEDRDDEADDDQNKEDEAGVEKRDTICSNL